MADGGCIKKPAMTKCFAELYSLSMKLCKVKASAVRNFDYDKALGVAICKSESFTICLGVSLVVKG